MGSFESKQKQHNQQQQKPVFFLFLLERRSWYSNAQCGGVITSRILHKKQSLKSKKELKLSLR
jgi:hypothetical protein